MPNGRKIFATFASSILMAASALAATPASAQTAPETDNNSYGCYDPTSGGYGGYGSGYGCCEYDAAWDNWYRNYSWGREVCDPPYQSPDQPTDSASQEAAEPAE